MGRMLEASAKDPVTCSKARRTASSEVERVSGGGSAARLFLEFPSSSESGEWYFGGCNMAFTTFARNWSSVMGAVGRLLCTMVAISV